MPSDGVEDRCGIALPEAVRRHDDDVGVRQGRDAGLQSRHGQGDGDEQEAPVSTPTTSRLVTPA